MELYDIEIMGFLLVLFAFIFLFVMATSVAAYAFLFLFLITTFLGNYVLQSVGLYRIAERRFCHSIFAWFPFARSWLLGKLADQYEEAAHHKKTYYGELLLWSSIAAAVISLIILATTFGAGLLSSRGNKTDWIIVPVSAVFVAYLLLMIAHTVFFYLALYRLYKSCEQQKAVTYIVLSIFVRITMPVFVVLCGKKDSPVMQDYLYRQSGRT